MGVRIILHIDMNAFYCSVHEAVEPDKYRGKALAVGGNIELRKGIIVTSSYAARAQGVKTGMQIRQALKLCPGLIVLEPDFHLYRRFSRRFMQIAESYSPLVEAMSIDECYIDITGSGQFGSPLDIAAAIQRRIREELGLPCSVGIGPNKLLAKMASDMKKPNGLTVLRKRDVQRLLWHRPCSDLFGIGHRTGEKLRKLNIRTIGELAGTDEAVLVRQFGVYGSWLKRASNGIDDAPVNPEREPNKSVGHTTTLPYNLHEESAISRVFLNLSDQVARRMRRQELIASTIQIVIRDPEMNTITRSTTLPRPTEDAFDIHRTALKLFREHWGFGKPVRLLGVTLQNLQAKREAAVQLDLFDYEQQPKKERLNETMDLIRNKYGESAIVTLGMLSDDPSALIRDHKRRGTSLQMDHMREKRNTDSKPEANMEPNMSQEGEFP